MESHHVQCAADSWLLCLKEVQHTWHIICKQNTFNWATCRACNECRLSSDNVSYPVTMWAVEWQTVKEQGSNSSQAGLIFSCTWMRQCICSIQWQACMKLWYHLFFDLNACPLGLLLESVLCSVAIFILLCALPSKALITGFGFTKSECTKYRRESFSKIKILKLLYRKLTQKILTWSCRKNSGNYSANSYSVHIYK